MARGGSVHQIFTQLIHVLFSWLGISQKQEFVIGVLLLIGLFFIYAGRQFRETPVYSLLYLVAGMGGVLFLMSETTQGRKTGGVAFVAASIAAFAYYFIRRSIRRAAEADDDSAH